MFTIFTIPKPFKDHIGIIQRNALQSWTMLRPACEIILCGDELGIKEAAFEFGVKHLSDISCNEFGTPFLDSAFEKVVNMAHFPIVCYVNADIILLSDLLDAIKRISFNQFVAVGRRTNVEIGQQWDFEISDWHSRLVEFAIKNGQLEGPEAIDCFVFTPNGHLEELPPFLVGRPAWDNWFLYNARKHHVPVIDFTHVCPLVHQNHKYFHVPQREGDYWEGPEANYNRELLFKSMRKSAYFFNIYDATHILKRESILPAFGQRYLVQRWNTAVVLFPSLKHIVAIVNSILRLFKRIKDGLR